MGAYSSHLVVDKKKVIKNLKPSNQLWLFRHAEMCGMPFAEVVRCWRRFVLLGPNKKGELTQQSSIWQSEDKFVQQMLRQLPLSPKGTLNFQTFLIGCKWLSTADPVVKLKVFYSLLNRGQPVNNMILQRVLRHVYPDKNDEELASTAQNFINQISTTDQDHIDEEEFIEFAKHIPLEVISSILQFDIIPSAIKTMALDD